MEFGVTHLTYDLESSYFFLLPNVTKINTYVKAFLT